MAPDITPDSPPPPRRRRVARVLSWVAVVLSAATLVLGGGAYGYFTWIDSKIERIDIGPLPGRDRGQASKRTALNFLLLGSDTREGATPEELAEFGTEFEGGGRRSDTIILLHLSADRQKSVLVSFPRDAYVDIPGHGRGKINTAYGRGANAAEGVQTLKRTIESLTGLPIHHFIGIDFRGFLKMVEALDGVDVCLSKPARDPKAGLNLPAGTTTVKGKQALAFVRTRSIDGRVDFGRIERQQKFLASMLDKATSLGVLANPLRAHDFISNAARAVTLDQGLSLGVMTDLALNLRGLEPGKVTFLTAPVKDVNAWIGRQSVVLLDADAGRVLWDAIRRDAPLPGSEPVDPSAPALTVAPSAIRLRVLNGAGIPGLAKRAGTALSGLGFRIVGRADADADTYTETIVRYGVDRLDAARTVAAAIPNARLQVDGTLERTIEVVLGSTYAGVQPVTVRASNPPRTGIAPAPFEQRTAADDPCS